MNFPRYVFFQRFFIGLCNKIEWYLSLSPSEGVLKNVRSFLLKEEKMKVTKAWNGLEAVEIFENSEPGYFDVILMDLMMPKMGGLEASRRIRKLDREDAKSIPVFAMTANAFLDDIAQSKAAGMNEHFSKPLQMEKVIDTIRLYCTAR